MGKTSTVLSDEELIQLIVNEKNTELFAMIYDRYAEVVYNKCLSFSKSKEEAEDLTHDIFVLLYAKLRTFKHQSKFSTWLYSFVYNFCVNYVNRTLKKKKEKFVNTDDIQQYAKDEISDDEILKLEKEQLSEALGKLDPKDRMILLMKYQDDMSIKDIMEHLEVGKSAAKMRVNRAKKKLMQVYNSM